MKGKRFILSCLIFLKLLNCQSQADTSKKSSEKNLKVLPLPMLWYTPETKFGFGLAAMFSFRFDKKNQNERVSSIQLGEAYTQEKQWINFSSFQLFPYKEKMFIYGEAGYYKYRYYFFGVGNHIPSDKKEKYDIDFTRIRANVTWQFIPKFYVGIRYWFENHKSFSSDTSGFLLNENYIGFPNAQTSSPGLVLLYDNRDHIFFPTKGWFAEFSIQRDDDFTGSDFSFTRVSIDISKYISIKEKHVLALNGFSVLTPGDVPFTQLAMLGGNKKMRGYYEGRFRDHVMFLFQAEMRIQVFERWFINTFASSGWVADKISHIQLQHTRISAGLGIRFRIDKKNKINLRLDSAYGKDGLKNYFTFNEAF